MVTEGAYSKRVSVSLPKWLDFPIFIIPFGSDIILVHYGGKETPHTLIYLQRVSQIQEMASLAHIGQTI